MSIDKFVIGSLFVTALLAGLCIYLAQDSRNTYRTACIEDCQAIFPTKDTTQDLCIHQCVFFRTGN